MTTEDKSQMPKFSPEDEKEAQKAPDHHSTNGTLKATNKWTGFQGKTMWDWLQLLGVLAIPLVVAGATLLFGIQQANLANQQHEADQMQALDQQQAAILQTYINNIQDLLLHDNLRGSKAGDEVAVLARAQTLTALQGLDPERKGRLVQFIYEALLIGFIETGLDKNIQHDPIIVLRDADLRRVYLNGAILNSVVLSFADLRGADLNDTNLSFAYLGFTDLRDADLRGADLEGAHLSNAHLSSSKNLTQQQLDQVSSCKDAIFARRVNM